MQNMLAFDLGGTFSKYGVVNEVGVIIKKGKEPTAKTLAGLLDFMKRQVVEHAAYHIDGVAVSTPGVVLETGHIHGGSALSYIHGPNILELMEEATGLPVALENDANCAALAEMWQGAAKGKKDVAVVVIGTGVGGALIKNGLIHKGANLHGGEFGYMILNPENIGNNLNTFSNLASTSSIVRRVAMARGVSPETLSGMEIFEAADNGDEQCIEAIDEFYRMLAVAIFNIQYIYDPELILLGGGISVRHNLVAKLQEELTNILRKIDIAKVKPDVAVCHFQADANLIGAAYHFVQTKR